MVAQVPFGGEHGAAAGTGRLAAVHGRVVGEVGGVPKHLVAQTAGERTLLASHRSRC